MTSEIRSKFNYSSLSKQEFYMSSIALSTPTTTKKIWTDAELMALTDGKCYELVNGEIIEMENSGALHSAFRSKSAVNSQNHNTISRIYRCKKASKITS
jgi:hypothetical protein